MPLREEVLGAAEKRENGAAWRTSGVHDWVRLRRRAAAPLPPVWGLEVIDGKVSCTPDKFATSGSAEQNYHHKPSFFT